MNLRQWFRWRKFRVPNRHDRVIEWWPVVRFGRHPRWALWLVKYENPKEGDQ